MKPKVLSCFLALVSLLGWVSGTTRAKDPAPIPFAITIDKNLEAKWGFQYPVTYVFRVEGVLPKWEVKWRKSAAHPWQVLDRKTAADFFNGIACARFDPEAGKLYVSIGFQGTHTIELALSGFSRATFEAVARYYDGRKAAYTLSNDNWGCNAWAHAGAPWQGTTNDESDNYQAALHVCRSFHLPVSMAINSRSDGGAATWKNMQQELDLGDRSWEPAVHGRTHPKDRAAYLVNGYGPEILGCRDDILQHLRNIPYGPHIYEHILTYGYVDETIQATGAGEFLFLAGSTGWTIRRARDLLPGTRSTSSMASGV